ncbi:Lysophospholipase [Sandaracinus amylolyticus]|uniref:Lysophospholipase n=2 Tax=Sandaracinus amylolyticus TaxID=927083 RepID=A0A0F6SE49_9BACT|nr:Lysophospholipase [Sandaracinus amylolyticus]
MRMRDEMIRSNDGTNIFTRAWRPSGPARAVVALVHGFKAHGGLYEWAGIELAKRGIAAYALDLRGHGRSEGARLWVESFSKYLEDVDALVQMARGREPGLPIFVLGHSAGGVISCGYVLEHQRELAGFVCESFAHEIPAPDVALTVIKGLDRIAPALHLLKLEDEAFSRDPAFVARMKSDPLIDRQGYPAHSVAELVRADERLKKGDFAKITLPVLILHGSADRVTKPSGSRRFEQMGGSGDKTLKVYEGHYHDLLNDIGREQVLDDVVKWMLARIPRAVVTTA